MEGWPQIRCQLPWARFQCGIAAYCNTGGHSTSTLRERCASVKRPPHNPDRRRVRVCTPRRSSECVSEQSHDTWRPITFHRTGTLNALPQFRPSSSRGSMETGLAPNGIVDAGSVDNVSGPVAVPSSHGHIASALQLAESTQLPALRSRPIDVVFTRTHNQ
jgi:hypothetical protein